MKKYISSTFEIGQIVMIEEEGSLTNLFIPGENRTSAKRQKENAVEEEGKRGAERIFLWKANQLYRSFSA